MVPILMYVRIALMTVGRPHAYVCIICDICDALRNVRGNGLRRMVRSSSLCDWGA